MDLYMVIGELIFKLVWLKIIENYLPFVGSDRGIEEGELSGNTIIIIIYYR